MGFIGLINILVIEGEKYNVVCNIIVLIVGLRLIKGLLFFDVFDVFKLEYVVFFVVYFCYESCLESGGVFEMVLGWGV